MICITNQIATIQLYDKITWCLQVDPPSWPRKIGKHWSLSPLALTFLTIAPSPYIYTLLQELIHLSFKLYEICYLSYLACFNWTKTKQQIISKQYSTTRFVVTSVFLIPFTLSPTIILYWGRREFIVAKELKEAKRSSCPYLPCFRRVNRMVVTRWRLLS